MKKMLIFLSGFFIFIYLTLPSYAHPGSTDQNGGHHDLRTNDYHYHHGYPAHSHVDVNNDGKTDCPYNFIDQTGINSNRDFHNDYSETPQHNLMILSKKSEDYIVPISLILPVAVICLFIIVLMALSVKRKKHEIIEIKEQYRKSLEQQSGDIRDKLELINQDLVSAFGDKYLYVACGAPIGDFIGPDELPTSDDTDEHTWGLNYTLYLAGINYSNTVRYHTATCRYANKFLPINAHTINRKPYKYCPCSICKPRVANTEWVRKYLRYRSFLKAYGLLNKKQDVSENENT